LDFYEQVEELAVQAFDDQCTGANPRYPLIRELKELYVLAYQGCQLTATRCAKTSFEKSESEVKLLT